MSTGMSFHSELSQRLEAQYTRPAVVLRPAKARKISPPKLSEDILDIGRGPGFLTADLAAGIGEEGSVLGVDQSDTFYLSLDRYFLHMAHG